MAETKTYKGKKNDYYGGRFEYLVGPIDTTNTLGMQNEPTEGYNAKPTQFGRPEAEEPKE